MHETSVIKDSVSSSSYNLQESHIVLDPPHKTIEDEYVGIIPMLGVVFNRVDFNNDLLSYGMLVRIVAIRLHQ